jgi:hypothetical protein
MKTPAIEIFLSHADKDKKIAKKLADELSNYGMKIFVAHEDIKIGEKWETTLFDKIKECDLFVALLSENFHAARYTDHEVGIAYGLNKFIFPIRIDDIMPYGFMSKFQAKKISPEIDNDEVVKVFYSMVSKSEKGLEMMNNLIEEFSESASFITANNLTLILSQYSEFSDEQLNRIAKAFLDNNQINQGFKSSHWCASLFNENWKKLDMALRDKLERFL